MKKRARLIILWVVVTTAFLVACNRTSKEPLVPLSEEFSFEASSDTELVAEEADTDTEGEKQQVVVHICGAVKHSGVYELPVGSRYCDAVAIAGGFTEQADTEYLNMAKLLEDGMQLKIPTIEEVKSAEEQGVVFLEDGTLESRVAKDGLIDINHADISDLCSLPGIGESRAESIIAYRQEHGDFQQKEDIMNVAGIKSGMYEQIQSLITVK